MIAWPPLVQCQKKVCQLVCWFLASTMLLLCWLLLTTSTSCCSIISCFHASCCFIIVPNQPLATGMVTPLCSSWTVIPIIIPDWYKQQYVCFLAYYCCWYSFTHSFQSFCQKAEEEWVSCFFLLAKNKQHTTMMMADDFPITLHDMQMMLPS